MPPRRLGTTLAYVATFLVAALVGRMWGADEGGAAVFWPEGGVAALWMLSGRGRPQVTLDAALILVSSAALDVLLGEDVVPALLFGLANVVLAVTVRLFSARFEELSLWDPQPRRIATPRDLAGLGIASLAAAFASAIPGLVGVLVSTGELTWGLVAAWLARNFCSTFVVVAAVLALLTTLLRAHARRGWTAVLTPEARPHWLAELVTLAAISAASATLVFGSNNSSPLAFGMLGASTWVGYRYSPAVGGVYILGLAMLATLCTVTGQGPFMAIDSLTLQAVTVQFYVGVTTVLVLILSLGAYEKAALDARGARSEARARSRADLLNAVMEAIHDGLIVFDPSGRPVLANQAAVDLAGNPHNPGEVGPPEDHGLFHTDGSVVQPDEIPHVRVLRDEEVVADDFLRIDPDTGHQATLSISAFPLARADGREPLAVLLLHDVTQERAHRRELQAFAGTVAHDLKTPLTGVGSWAEILGDQLDDLEAVGIEVEELRESLTRISASADRMEQLISDLLTYSLAQTAVLNPVVVALDALVDAVVDDLCRTAVGTPPLIEHGPLDVVLADLPMVRQLFTNVIGNAVKYVAADTTPHVVITSKVVGEMVEVRVSDNGIGIPRTERGLIFDSFYRAPSARRYPGTGLGLSICARVVQQHGGRISAREGLDDQGTTLVFTLPADPVSDAQGLGDTTSADPPPRRVGSDTAVR